MNITNRSNLPEALVRALQNDSYDAGDSDYTATSLIKPVQQKALQDRYYEQIEEDAEDGIYRLYGQVAHGILERANLADLAEKRFFAEFSGKRVSAQIDTLSISDGVLSDFKFTTSWGFTKSKLPKADWVAQLNIQLELLRRNGLDAESLQIIGLLRDWQIREAKLKPDYPQSPVATLSIPMWSREQTVSFIEMRIAEHEAAKLKPDELLPECSFEERYAGKEAWAVVKIGKGGKSRAIPGGVQYSQELAESICSKTPGSRVEYRREEPFKRCENYCSVSAFCVQYQKSQSANRLADQGEKDAV